MSFVTNNIADYDTRKAEFEALKDTLPKEPSGDVKKEYCVGCFQKSDWEFIHEELMKDGSLEDNIPTDKCECINDCLQSDVRGVYLLTDTEATELKGNSKVDYVHINSSAYPGTYAPNPDDLLETTSFRYSSTVKNQQEVTTTSGGILENLNSDKLNRCSSQLYRHTAKKNPWVTLGNPQTVVSNRLEKYGTGVDVDVIVCDTDMWFGHIEFQDPDDITNIKTYDASQPGNVGGSASTVAPSDFVGGNVLKSGFASSSTNGTCGILDLVLDAPYYIDSAWFEADAGNRLMTRWDGTTVPVESVAREWWSDASKRSAAYSGVGTVQISSLYTRAACNGSNTAYKTGLNSHGTPCASQAYGRQFGWAYNANKWFLNLYGTFGVLWEKGFDLQKIFHQHKPNRSSDNTKNPTISSNSWGRRFNTGNLGSSGYYFYRPATTDGNTTGTQFQSWDMDGNTDGTIGTAPRFMTNRVLDTQGSGVQCEPVSGSPVTAANEMITAGVIFVAASGNQNQKMVKSTHADYDNYVGANNNSSLSSTEFYVGYDQITYHKTLNRGGFPNAFTGTISVGALDDTLLSGKEKKVYYSSMGDLVDCYAAADQSLAASDNRSNGYARYDSFYTYDSSQSVLSYDKFFNGTSSACPIAVGLIATKLQYNRTWTSSNIKTWLSSTVGQQNTADFHYGTDSGSINDSGWADQNSIQGGAAIVPFDTAVDTTDPTLSSSVPSNNATGVALNANIVLNFSEAVIAQSGNIVIYKASDNSVIETISVTGSLVTGSGTSQITVNPTNDLIANTTFYIQIASTAFDDAAGNSYAGISDTTSLRFTTVTTDTTNPTLISSSPSTNATGVAVDTNIILNFSEAVIAQSGNITIYKADGTLVENITVTSSLVTGSGTSQITVNPNSDLSENTTFYILIASTAFDDAAGNSYAGISDSVTLRFTTGSDPDPDPPIVDGEYSVRFFGNGLTLNGQLVIT